MKKLSIKNLVVEVENKIILKDVSLDVDEGDIVALVGPNGHGKSTLLNVLMGNPQYKVVSGNILLDGEDITSFEPDKRSKLGLFMAFQTPPEIEGVSSLDYYKEAINAHLDKPITLFKYYKALNEASEKVKFDSTMKSRALNVGFSGGEKKRNEILQMLLLNPTIALLDEIDSGLDVDAFKLIADNILEVHNKIHTSFIIVSHYDKLYKMVKPNKTAVLIDGRIAMIGDGDLALYIASEGYESFSKKYHIDINKKEREMPVLQSRAAKRTNDK